MCEQPDIDPRVDYLMLGWLLFGPVSSFETLLPFGRFGTFE